MKVYPIHHGMPVGAWWRLLERGDKHSWTQADVERLRAKVARIPRKGDRDA